MGVLPQKLSWLPPVNLGVVVLKIRGVDLAVKEVL